MNDITKNNTRQLRPSLLYVPAEPLYKRVPSTDENGRPLSDFMMILPTLRGKSQRFIQEKIQIIETILDDYARHVVFADLNLKLNVLWVIVRPTPGICWELPMKIHHRVPEALLVGQPAF